MSEIDTIIVGSGISGMAAGILLARAGEKVLVLEQHRIPGGLTHTFERAGTVFPTGVHRLGSLEPGQPLWLYFNYLGLLDRLDLVPMNQEGFETYYFPDTIFKVPRGREAYQKALSARFPDQTRGIARYFSDMARAVAGARLYDPGCREETGLSEFTLSLDAYFDAIGLSGKARAILAANNPLFGLPSHECPVFTHFIITDSYLRSSFRINEAATPLACALTGSFEDAGGRIRTGKRVSEFLIRDRAVQGVRLAGGETFMAGRVIYSGHPAMLPSLCPPKTFRPVYEKRLASVENTPGLYGISLIWEKNNCPVADNDAYIYGTWDVNAHYTEDAGTNGPGMIFLSALPEKPAKGLADTAEGMTDSKLAVTALTALSHRDQEQLNRAYGARGKKQYLKMKDDLTRKTMEGLDRIFPGTRENARVVAAYSPATFERYTLTPEGTAYGIRKTAQAFLQGMFSPATRVRGLFLTGQSIGFCGIHGGISASVNLCKELIPGIDLMEDIRTKGRAVQ